eukprot:2774903-Pleurochrysis_carterae.AAC.1
MDPATPWVVSVPPRDTARTAKYAQLHRHLADDIRRVSVLTPISRFRTFAVLLPHPAPPALEELALPPGAATLLAPNAPPLPPEQALPAPAAGFPLPATWTEQLSALPSPFPPPYPPLPTAAA